MPSYPNEKGIPMKLIHSAEYALAGTAVGKVKVSTKLTSVEIRAIVRTIAVFRKNGSDRPVINGIKRIISSIMRSNCQDKYDE